jgi:carbon monoxide dehydrogenase subunit G
MELTNDFTVNAPIDQAWDTLTDVERIAPCLPGAQLTEIEGDTYRGLVKVKVGPITAQFKGQASFVEKDEAAHRAVLKAEGRDTGGKGNASALITAQLETVEPQLTKVTVATDLTITGKVAQFGRGALADVSEKLLKQFVTNLESSVLAHGDAGNGASAEASTPAGTDVTAGNGASTATDAPTATEATTPQAVVAPEAAPSSAPSSGVRTVESAPVEPIDLLDAAGAPLLKRLLPLIGGAVALIVVWRLLRRRR